jgi:hypothetical protein
MVDPAAQALKEQMKKERKEARRKLRAAATTPSSKKFFIQFALKLCVDYEHGFGHENFEVRRSQLLQNFIWNF